MSELKGAMIIGQSGGPTAVINASVIRRHPMPVLDSGLHHQSLWRRPMASWAS